MTKHKKKKKDQEQNQEAPKKTISKISSNSGATSVNATEDLLFGKRNYAFLLAGIGLITLGYFLMAGGKMPNPETWDESLIYSTRRTLIAPICILAGLGLQVYTIFAKK